MEHQMISNKGTRKMKKVRAHILDALYIWKEEIEGEDKNEFIARWKDHNHITDDNLAKLLYEISIKLSEINR